MVILQLEEQPPLIQAIFAGDVEEVRTLLDYKQDVNCLDIEKRSPLHAAAFKGNTAIASVLLENGARVNTKDSKWLTPLHRACCTGAHEIVSLLLRYQADTSARDKLWQTPLHVAAANDSYVCVAQLLNEVPNPNVTDRSGRTALHHAAFNGHTYMVELLLSKGCIVNACDKKDCRPLHCAAHMGHTDTVGLLLKCGADINARDRNQYTPLHVAAASGMDNVCRLLLNSGAEIDAQNAYGNTPLHIACLNGHLAICQELVAYNAAVEAINYRGQTPLHIAAASTHGVDCLMFLLEQEVNINKQSLDGRTPLHMTAIHGRFTRSKTLIDRGAIVDCVDRNKSTPLHIAAQYGYELLANTLLTYGADPKRKGYEGRTPLHMCCLSGHVECCRKFIQAGVELNCQDNSGKTATHCAAYKGSVECLDLLVSNNVNFKIVDNIGRTALHYAAAQGHYQCVFTLVSIGSNVNDVDNEGCTPLHLAAAYDTEGKCVEYLVQHRADICFQDNNGFTPIHYAVNGGNFAVVNYLLSSLGPGTSLYGEIKPLTTPLHLAAKNGNVEILHLIMPYFNNINISAANGMTPLMLAAKEGHPGCVQMLLRFGAKVAVADTVHNMTALHYSAKNGHIHCLALLLDNTEDRNVIDVQDKYDRTALMLAVSGNHSECVLTLLKSGANPNVCDADLHSSLFRAVVAGQNSIAQLLLSKGAHVACRDIHGKTVLHLAAACGHFACLQSILNHMNKEEPLSFDNQQCTALHWACYSGNPNCVEYLLQKDIFESLIGNSFSPVHCATFSGSEKCLELLCKYYGSEIVKLKDTKKRRPLHIACVHGHVECAKFLLDEGAETEVKDEEGRTPFIAAAQHGQSQIIDLLMNYNAEKTSYDIHGNTALHWACLKKHNHTALLLLEYIDSSDIVNMVNNDRKTPLHLAAKNGLVDVTHQLIKKGASLVATDSDGLTPALCCAPTKSVANCLAIILQYYLPTQDLNKVMEKQLLSNVSCKHPGRKLKKFRSQKLQTELSLLHDPDLFECQKMFNFKLPSKKEQPKIQQSRKALEQLKQNLLNNLFSKEKPEDMKILGDNLMIDTLQNSLTEIPSVELHKSHSDIYISYKRNEACKGFKESFFKPQSAPENSRLDSKEVSSLRTFSHGLDDAKVCYECIRLRKRCPDCTLKKLFKQHSQGKINKQEFQYMLLRIYCESLLDSPQNVDKFYESLYKTPAVKSINETTIKKNQEEIKTGAVKKVLNPEKSRDIKKYTIKNVIGEKSRKNADNPQSESTSKRTVSHCLQDLAAKKVLEEVIKKNLKKEEAQMSQKLSGYNRNVDKTHLKTQSKPDRRTKTQLPSKKSVLNIEMPVLTSCDLTETNENLQNKSYKLNKSIVLNKQPLKAASDQNNQKKLQPKKISSAAERQFMKIIDTKNDRKYIKRPEKGAAESIKVLESRSDEDIVKIQKLTDVEPDNSSFKNAVMIEQKKKELFKKIEIIATGLETVKNTNYLNHIIDYVQDIIKTNSVIKPEKEEEVKPKPKEEPVKNETEIVVATGVKAEKDKFETLLNTYETNFNAKTIEPEMTNIIDTHEFVRHYKEKYIETARKEKLAKLKTFNLEAFDVTQTPQECFQHIPAYWGTNDLELTTNLSVQHFSDSNYSINAEEDDILCFTDTIETDSSDKKEIKSGIESDTLISDDIYNSQSHDNFDSSENITISSEEIALPDLIKGAENIKECNTNSEELIQVQEMCSDILHIHKKIFKHDTKEAESVIDENVLAESLSAETQPEKAVTNTNETAAVESIIEKPTGSDGNEAEVDAKTEAAAKKPIFFDAVEEDNTVSDIKADKKVKKTCSSILLTKKKSSNKKDSSCAIM